MTAAVAVDSATKSKTRPYVSGLPTGLKETNGKGRRLTIVPTGRDLGFIDGGLLVFESKSTRAYQEEIKGELFLTCIQLVVSTLQRNILIVTDNAP
jgi:hypothetical protein